ncbi:protein ILRUN-like isoform X2 [Stegodyphus dumicola]|uniref:protein ILRUN-like isoform X2 n=1 Tax=Stegodyphus dumicola TaxID=202533 RepID=UPI0015AC2E48|nr:protein ILRUN-like isoform X2 [Stegodyphus dumicola]
MDIDRDFDASLLQQFSCLGTTDRDVLISQLQKLLGDQLNPAGCAFFLDMNNWNLQAAVCAYFDFDSPRDNLPRMSFVRDVTIGDGEAVSPNMKFVKTWSIQNPSQERWPPGCSLRFVGGDRMSHIDRVFVDPLEPHEMVDVSVEMVSPQTPGMYQGQWRMSTATGQFFGEVIWVIVTVAEGGVLSLTQQMDAFHQLGSPPRTTHMPINPFASSNSKCRGSFDSMASSQLPHNEYPISPTSGENSFSHENSISSSPVAQELQIPKTALLMKQVLQMKQ